MVENKQRKVFYRRAIKVGNSSGVLLPKSLLGSEVRVVLIHPPKNIKKDTTLLLSPILEEILGIYFIEEKEKKVEILAISTNINRHMNKGIYEIDVVPLEHLKKSLKNNQEIKDKIKKAKVVINSQLLNQLKKSIS
jgi:putative transposon-encoded protein